MSERNLCIHGHFYQPPRENPWLEAIERQDSAHPYHDWNARIAAECYAPNAWSRLLDGEGRITGIVNNYERISFNFGPTLLSWLEWAEPETYQAILLADQRSAQRFGGHGSALGQAYGHTILPLSNTRDRMTQVRWGIRDFEHRFGRKPEGMWLPEAAVDLETLDILASEGIKFTLLAYYQAARVRPIGREHWDDVTGGRIDRGRPYVQRLPSGRSIALFFYDGALSQAIAFEGLLNDGHRFAERLIHAFMPEAEGPRIVHVATDGESYGHHHKHGEMALAYALKVIEEDPSVTLTNYGEYLEKHPPTDEVEILENTSWSCYHGIERWRSDCGCRTGGEPGWNQAWRAPLREALDWLRGELEPRYEEAARELFDDPWGAREAYIDVVLDRSSENLDRWLGEHARRQLSGGERVRALQLLELQRHAMMMYTSCGWFFNELAGIETVQVLQYAGRAVQLGQELFPGALEEGFLERLERARSNIPEKGNGRRIYELHVRPAMVELDKVGAHYAVSSLFEDYPEEARIHAFRVERQDERRETTGRARLSLGRVKIHSVITCKAETLSYGVLHLGDHNVVGGVRAYQGEEAYRQLAGKIVDDFSRADFPAVIRTLDESFAASTYSLRSLFRDEQQTIIKRILDQSVRRAAGQLEQIYENRAPLMRFLADLELQAPRPFRIAAEFVINTRLRMALGGEDTADGGIDVPEARRWLAAARREKIELEDTELAFAAQRALERLARRWADAPENLERLERLEEAVQAAGELPFEVDLWAVQNTFWRVVQESREAERRRGGRTVPEEWAEEARTLGVELRVAVGELERSPAR